MANDFKGDPKEFAIVIPVPTVLQKDQIHVGEKALLDHLDAYSSPRLVEYFDEDPCRMGALSEMVAASPAPNARMQVSDGARAKSLGVTIEAQYTVGEYDILILSAQQSGGLETWLRENDYRIPAGATSVLNSYIKQNMKFFVAKVNLQEQKKLGYSMLRPIQVAFESPKFMLPIRLGTVNADGPQELFIYALTRKGRVEATNYRTVKLPSNLDLPVYVKDRFGDFYKAMFAHQVAKENMSTIFTEYAWDMAWCDPCAADPLSREELRSLGVFWLDESSEAAATGRRAGQTVPDHGRATERLHDPPARPLRRRALSGRPRVPGDGGPHELSGPLRAATRVEGLVFVRSCRILSPGVAAASRPPGAEPRVVDRLGHRTNQKVDERRQSATASDTGQVVAKDLAIATRLAVGSGERWITPHFLSIGPY